MKKPDRDIMEILDAYDVALVGTVADHDTTLDPDYRSFRCYVRAQHSGAFHDFLGLHEFEFLLASARNSFVSPDRYRETAALGTRVLAVGAPTRRATSVSIAAPVPGRHVPRSQPIRLRVCRSVR